MPKADIDYSASPDSLTKQLDNAHRRIADLEAENVSLKRTVAARVGDLPHLGLLTRIAAALLLAGEAEQAVQASQIDSNGRVMRTQTTGFSAPGAATWSAREAARVLRKGLAEACSKFEHSAEHNWHPPRASDEIPKVRWGACPPGGA